MYLRTVKVHRLLDLKDFAPQYFQSLVHNPRVEVCIGDLIKEHKYQNGVREWADPKEKKEITELSNQTIKLLTFMLDLSQATYKGAALEVACGQGLLARDLLVSRYSHVHLFDRDAACLRKISQWKKYSKDTSKKVACTEVAAMQNFQWDDRKYVGVYFRWCLGYLDYNEAKDILKKAQSSLDYTNNSKKRLTRNQSQPFIIVIDNVVEIDACDPSFKAKGQSLRSMKEWDILFRDAGLQQKHVLPEGPRPLKANYWPVNIWFLR